MTNYKTIFNNIFYENDKFFICYIDNIYNFIDNVHTWKYNRTIDMKRIPKIVNAYLQDNIPETPFFISEFKENDKSKYRIWDGQHRYYAIKKMIKDNTAKQINMINDIIKNKIICYVYKNQTEQSTFNLYYNLHLSVPVAMDKKIPNIDIYEIIKNTCDYIISKLISEFPEYQKPSKNPRKPNYNIDRVQEKLQSYLLNKQNYLIPRYILWENIYKLNNHLSLTKDDKYEKYFKTNKYNNKLYLFIIDDFTEQLNNFEEIKINSNLKIIEI
jgi:hypothetical protein